jgi:hypothetical protein
VINEVIGPARLSGDPKCFPGRLFFGDMTSSLFWRSSIIATLQKACLFFNSQKLATDVTVSVALTLSNLYNIIRVCMQIKIVSL